MMQIDSPTLATWALTNCIMGIDKPDDEADNMAHW
jgi:hypothetical protein